MTWRKSDGRSLRGARVVEPGPVPPTRTVGKRGPPISRPKAPKSYRSEAYLRFVRSKPCVFFSRSCRGPVEAHHHGKHPIGQKTDDTRCVPLCNGHHRELTDTGHVEAAPEPRPPTMPNHRYVLEDGMLPFITKAALDAALVDLLVEWIGRDGR